MARVSVMRVHCSDCEKLLGEVEGGETGWALQGRHHCPVRTLRERVERLETHLFGGPLLQAGEEPKVK